MSAKRKRAVRQSDDFDYEDKDEPTVRESKLKAPPKPTAAPPAPIKLKITQPLQQKLSAEEDSLLSKYAALRAVREQARRQPTEQTPADKAAAATKAAEEATKAAIAAISKMSDGEKQQAHDREQQQASAKPSRRRDNFDEG